MTEDQNLYRAPEASIVEPIVTKPRTFLVFLAGSSCWGGSLLFLLATIGATHAIVSGVWEGEWQMLITRRSGRWFLLSDLFYFSSTATFFAAGRSFFAMRWRRGSQFLLVAMISAAFAWMATSILFSI